MEDSKQELTPNMRIKITEDGPYIVSGNIPLDEKIITPEHHHYVFTEGRPLNGGATYALCRCGKSSTPPFCDGSHVADHFDGTETASRLPYKERADIFTGPGIDLRDDNRCAFARFCHREEGDVWQLTDLSDDAYLRDEAIVASSECPAGRLQHFDKDGNEIEPHLEPRITVLQDPQKGVSAGLYVQGGIPLESSDGTEYEVRNRYALCRCGASHNKPFCDAKHVRAHFEA
ncbi:MAG: CDGSH iron-sulfur domain-containing protein [Raoultibacter sp.]|jgi:CDGSH-type Zn-finger protein